MSRPGSSSRKLPPRTSPRALATTLAVAALALAATLVAGGCGDGAEPDASATPAPVTVAQPPAAPSTAATPTVASPPPPAAGEPTGRPTDGNGDAQGGDAASPNARGAASPAPPAGGSAGGTPGPEPVPAPDAPASVTEDAAVPTGQLTVHVRRPTELRTRPGGPVVARLAARTEFDSPVVLPVLRQEGDRLEVLSSTLPNGRSGWIRVTPGLAAHTSDYTVTASLGRREVVVRRAGRVVSRFPVAIGAPGTPTPTGRFAVTDKLLTGDPGSPYGCCILALSGHQTRLAQGWGGGDRLAIHATNHPETIGSAASLGCLRAPTEAIRRLVQTVPLGTVVTIRS
jgi:L,D-transpeptidase-like protein